jgi:Tfp pilus assembly protein PilE
MKTFLFIVSAIIVVGLLGQIAPLFEEPVKKPTIEQRKSILARKQKALEKLERADTSHIKVKARIKMLKKQIQTLNQKIKESEIDSLLSNLE